jgi:hypothetical protein
MRAVIWARVSTTEQETENQLRQLREAPARRGLEVVEPPYVAEASAWKGAHRRELERALADARAGRYDVLVVWALDRLTREDPLETLEGQAAAEVVGLRHTRGASRSARAGTAAGAEGKQWWPRRRGRRELGRVGRSGGITRARFFILAGLAISIPYAAGRPNLRGARSGSNVQRHRLERP